MIPSKQEQQQRAWSDIFCYLSTVLDYEGSKRHYHGWQSAILALHMARELQLENDDINEVVIAALLHDIGAIWLPNHILRYPSLSQQLENPLVRLHTVNGSQWVGSLPGMRKLPLYIMDHHEWVNGLGYPSGKSRDDIPLGASILRAADTFNSVHFASHGARTEDILQVMELNVNQEYPAFVFDALRRRATRENLGTVFSDPEGIHAHFEEVRTQLESINLLYDARNIEKVLAMFGDAVDGKHPFTSGHSTRVARYSNYLAVALGLDNTQVEAIRWAGYLHDIGRVILSSRLIAKPDSLTDEERITVQQHARVGEEIVSRIAILKNISRMIGAHHERFDGKGYHRGLAGDAIPLGARVLALADSFDAMVMHRAYRRKFSVPEALNEISKKSGTQFDPDVVEAGVPVLRSLFEIKSSS